MRKWTREPEERPGDYMFSGRVVMTVGVSHELDMEDVLQISTEIRGAVVENNGLEYQQVFKSEDGSIVWVIDQLSKSMKEGED